MKRTVIILGGTGRLGSALTKTLNRAWNVIPFSSRSFDLTTPKSAASLSELDLPTVDWVINCAAFTQVDLAEVKPELAYQVNALGVQRAAQLATRLGAGLVHISTDYVFNDTIGRKLFEPQDPICPVGVYGNTKAAGELMLQSYANMVAGVYLILRVSRLYGFEGDYVDQLVRTVKDTKQLNWLVDRSFTTMSIQNVVDRIAELISARVYPDLNFVPIFHGPAPQVDQLVTLSSVAKRICRRLEVPFHTRFEFHKPVDHVRPVNSSLGSTHSASNMETEQLEWYINQQCLPQS